MSEVLHRHLEMLRMIPRLPKKIAVQKIVANLEKIGYHTSARTIQRDLVKLSKIFPLVSDERDKPYGWSWLKDARVFDLPSMDINNAMTFYLAEKFLARLFPPSILENIQPHFQCAAQVLDRLPDKRLKNWRQKVRVLSRSQRLLPAEVNKNVMDTVYQGLLQEKQLSVSYQPRNSGQVEYIVNPRGLVIRDQVIYLVATLWNYDDIKQLLLHRMSDAELLDKPIKKMDFNLDDYIQRGEFDLVEQPKEIRLRMRVNNEIIKHLLETPLSSDQQVKADNEAFSILSATVKDTQQLRWWILGFGEGMEVIKPVALRREMTERVNKMLSRYTEI